MKSNLFQSYLLSLVMVFLTGVWTIAQNTTPYVLETRGGVVVSDSSIASRIGAEILRKGGNAVDASVATAFAMAVTWPEAGNIGGGGFMMIRPSDSRPPVCVDYREMAPGLASEDSFQVTDSTLDYKAVGVPGTVKGMALAHQKYGKLPWKDLVQPSVVLAKGFNVDEALARSTNSVLSRSTGPNFAELRKVYGKPDGTAWKAGDTMRLPELSQTLSLVAQQGPKGFYEGKTATLMNDAMEKANGLIRAEDLLAYRAKIKQPIIGTFRGYQIIGAPPPSSGGICIVQALNMVEQLDLDPQDRYSPKTMHLLAEVCRRVFLDRARHLGDPDFVEIPDSLTSKQYAIELVKGIDPQRATNSETLGPDIPLASESDNTTHFSIVDESGMAVSNTYTLEASWGSRMIVPGTGFVLNNEMGDFNWVKGLNTRRGRIGTKPNLVAPGKRMLSSQCPVIVTKDNEVRLVTGSPGGRTIINTVLGIVLNHTYFGENVSEAVAAPRFHHQWIPDQFNLEFPFDQKENEVAANELPAWGHTIVRRSLQGSAHSIQVNGNLKIAVADSRRSGRAAISEKDLIASWEFGKTKQLGLTSILTTGQSNHRWNREIPNVETDGNDHLVIGGQAYDEEVASFVELSDQDQVNVEVVVQLDGVFFRGDAQQENFSVGLAESKESIWSAVAALSIGRRGSDGIVLEGQAFGKGATSVSPVQIFKTNVCDEKFAVKLTLDRDNQKYKVGLRRGQAITFESVGEGNLSPERKAKYLMMSVRNDFSTQDEKVIVERIALSVAD
ncbi:MAG: gamma-glutamyltransferase [Planctomycetota bacterium]